jgi:hypothetical protein
MLSFTLFLAPCANLWATQLPTTETFTFTGTCTDCSNPEGVLVLQDYTFGQPIETSNFVSFSYSSSVLTYSISGEDAVNSNEIGGSLGPETGAYSVSFNLDGSQLGHITFDFTTNSHGTWDVNLGGPVFDYGTDATWSLEPTGTTPEPASLYLLASGAAATVAIRRRRLPSS